LARGAKNVSFLSGLTDDELHSYYSDCTALIVTQEEDFGITPLEAMAQGKPVIAFEKGGVLETCDEYGFYFKKQTAESLEQAVEKFKKSEAPERRALIRQAEKFSKERFDKELLFLVSSNDKA
jgi:glycosyltransferase involved in cell wall biosynthesis